MKRKHLFFTLRGRLTLAGAPSSHRGGDVSAVGGCQDLRVRTPGSQRQVRGWLFPVEGVTGGPSPLSVRERLALLPHQQGPEDAHGLHQERGALRHGEVSVAVGPRVAAGEGTQEGLPGLWDGAAGPVQVFPSGGPGLSHAPLLPTVWDPRGKVSPPSRTWPVPHCCPLSGRQGCCLLWGPSSSWRPGAESPKEGTEARS